MKRLLIVFGILIAFYADALEESDLAETCFKKSAELSQ